MNLIGSLNGHLDHADMTIFLGQSNSRWGKAGKILVVHKRFSLIVVSKAEDNPQIFDLWKAKDNP